LAFLRRRHAGWLRRAAVRIVGRTELLLSRVAPVVLRLLRLLRLLVRPLSAGVSGRRMLLMAARPVTRLR
jgi:hypothetical protein